MAALDDEKRNLVVKEIEAWRRSKLLPEQYCNFLQNLYLDDLNERPLGFMGNAIKKVGQASGKQWLLTFGIFTLICFVVLHFSAFPFPLQIGLTVVVTASFVLIGGRLREQSPVRALLSLGAGLAFLFGVGFGILRLNGWAEGSGPLWLLGLCAASLIGCGLAVRFAVLHLAGWITIVVLYALLLAQHVPSPTLLEVQVFWIPAALLFCWLSWFLHVRFQTTGGVLFAAAIILWFMPEVYSALYAIHIEWIQAEILLKIVIAGVSMFRLRKQWMEWVA
jgi:hypothetical protein